MRIESMTQKDALCQDELFAGPRRLHQPHRCRSDTWLFRQWEIVILFATLELMVNDLGVLMALFGAVGQTGLAGMPCTVFVRCNTRGTQEYVVELVEFANMAFCSVLLCSDDDWILLGQHGTFLGPRWSS